jgi:protease-4
MIYPDFIKEILDGNVAVYAPALQLYLPYIEQILRGEQADMPEKKNASLMRRFSFDFDELDTTEKAEQTTQESVAIIPIRGMLTKYGDWWDYGSEEYASSLRDAYKDPSVKAVILRIHSIGGTTHSVIPLEAAIQARNKPVIAAVDSMAMSAAYYISLFADKIIAIDQMAEVGSIGIMARILDDRKMKEEFGLKIIEIVPPESKWKNRAYNEALNGKPQLLIQEELSPWAQRFQNVVKTYRPSLDLSVEGIIEGRQFYAYDAQKNGLVDEVMPLEDIVQYAFDYMTNTTSKLFT